MTIRAITKAEFQELMPDEKKRFPAKHIEQKAWLASEDNRFLGVVLFDKFDEEPWCYCVLKCSSEGKYKNMGGELDVKDEKDGVSKLKKELEEHANKKPKKKS